MISDYCCMLYRDDPGADYEGILIIQSHMEEGRTVIYFDVFNIVVIV